MKKEIRTFFTALMFLTRLPVPRFTDHSPEYLERSPKYFPLVGWIVGAISGLVFIVFNRYISTPVAIMASMIAGLFVTGAFHEDGFADVCDAFGGGWTREKILVIMKDSRLGTFGTIGLIGILGSKFLLLREIPPFMPDLEHPSANVLANYRFFLGILIAAHAVSRLMPVWIIRFYRYVTEEGSKSKPLASRPPGYGELLLASLLGLLPFVLLEPEFLLALVLPVWVSFGMAAYFKKWIGGYTGDCLGAIQQVSEIAFYLSVVIIWKFF